jgi:hypothetical protein
MSEIRPHFLILVIVEKNAIMEQSTMQIKSAPVTQEVNPNALPLLRLTLE